MMYTVEMYKLDKRYKEGMKLTYKTDVDAQDLSQMERMYPRRPGYIVKIFETYVERKNFMTGESYQERYDVPYTCSPRSETYWST